MKHLLAALTVSLFAVATLHGADKEAELKVGDKAPSFTSTDDQGKEWKSSDYVGKKVVVVYFYPADLTGGCTAQACGFRDDLKKLQEEGVEVVGVSGDSVKNHQLFKKVHELNFTLLADEKGQVAKTLGVPYTDAPATITKEIDGKSYELTRGVTAKRWTVVIDKQGNVAAKYEVKKAGDDSKTIQEIVAKLK